MTKFLIHTSQARLSFRSPDSCIVLAPNHPLRPAVTALAIGNPGKRADAASPVPLGESRGKGAKSHEKARPHDTSRIAWAKLIAHIAEDFPLACPACGGDIRLIAFIVDPAPIRKILTHLGGAGGRFLPTPNQPSDTVQLGVGAIGGPWAY